MISKGRIFIILLLLASTWYVLQSVSDVQFVSVKKSLKFFPREIGGYSLSSSLQSSADVIEMLGVDDYIQYNYVKSANDRINLYVGYYGAVGVKGSYHSPKNCLPGGGWGIVTSKSVALNQGQAGSQPFMISEMRIQNGSDKQIVMYWYQNRGRIIASEYMEKFYLIVDALRLGRRDGAFIRLMTTVQNDDIAAAEQRLQGFAQEIIPLLRQHLPGEKL